MGGCNTNTSNINKTFIVESPVSGDTYVISGTLSGDTLSLLRNDSVTISISGFTDLYTTATTIIDDVIYFDTNDTLSAYTADLSGIVFSGGSGNCITDLFIETLNGCSSGITLNNDIIPNVDNTINLGTSVRRFRNINSVSGVSTVWTATTSVTTPNLVLGLDSSGNTRTITANNSIIQDDCLLGGTY